MLFIQQRFEFFVSVMIYSPIKSLESWLFIALNSSQINQSMLTWIAINDLLEDRTASIEDNLLNFELSLIIITGDALRRCVSWECNSLLSLSCCLAVGKLTLWIQDKRIDHTASRFEGREILFLHPQTSRSTPTVC